MSEGEAARPANRRRTWIGVGAAGALLALSGTAWALSGTAGAPAARPPRSAPPAATPVAAPSTATAPSVPPPPSATPAAAGPAPSHTRTAVTAAPTRKATTVPRWRVSPGTGDPNNDGGTVTRPTGCVYDRNGQVLTCDPVRTGTPLPRTTP